MKVMIDTNIIISAALSPNGNAAKAFMKAVLPPYNASNALSKVAQRFFMPIFIQGGIHMAYAPVP